MPEYLNCEFSERVVITPKEYQWEASPMLGVERMKLERIGDEIARATSLVRYAPNSEFFPHEHSGGEEFFVLDGVFSDEYGDYPAGYYLRNPIGSSHTPKIGAQGAVILVKLHQFDSKDTVQIRTDTKSAKFSPGMVAGLQVLTLHEFGTEHIALVKWAPNTHFSPHQHWGGEEIYVISGTFHDEYGSYPTGSWLRSPHMSKHCPFTKEDGALIYVKTGHLNKVKSTYGIGALTE